MIEYTVGQLRETMKLINAEQSDLYDVLAYIAFATPTVTREPRARDRLETILTDQGEAQKTFIRFVLDHYVDDGVDELALEKLPQLLELKYGEKADATAELGPVRSIRETFTGFQPSLYAD